MRNHKPDVTDEDIGMRAYELRKEKAAERALERIRQGVRADWPSLTQREINDLTWVLGELWAFEDRADWEELHFSKLPIDEIRQIIEHAHELYTGDVPHVETLKTIEEIVKARSV